jgi:DNA-binding CsgD family transcriptional regulator
VVNTSYDGEENDVIELRRERRIGVWFLITFAAANILDVIEDLHEGSPFPHVSLEIVMIMACLVGGFYLWSRLNQGWESKAHLLEDRLRSALDSAAKWREEAAALAKGLTDAIEAQLRSWGLSDSERDVAFLLIKGLSLKEIADLRSVSERTVRQQSTAVYKKSGLAGRAQLAAFFLEDLLFIPERAAPAAS